MNDMKCPYCGNEMEKGRIMASATGSIPIAILEWYAETEFDNKGLIAALKRKSIAIKDAKDGYYHNAYRCDECNIAFGEFPTQAKKRT